MGGMTMEDSGGGGRLGRNWDRALLLFTNCSPS